MEKTVVTVARKWNNPEITMTVNEDGIGIEMSLENFKEAVKAEIDSVTFVFSKNEFHRRLDVAFANIIRDMKRETTKIIK